MMDSKVRSFNKIWDMAGWYWGGHRATNLFLSSLDLKTLLAVSAVVVVPPYP